MSNHIKESIGNHNSRNPISSLWCSKEGDAARRYEFDTDGGWNSDAIR